MRVLMIAPTFLVVHCFVKFLISDRASRVTVKAIASHSECTSAVTVGRVCNACFNDCANILGRALFCQFLDF